MGAPLHRADGSATATANGYTVLGAVNGPLEVQRRDELPEEAAIEVNVRPAVGVASTKERHLETIISATLKRVILTRQFPRTLIQLTLQVISMPDPSTTPKTPGLSPISPLPLLPALLEASLKSLLASAIPLETVYATASILGASSFHVFAFDSKSKCLVNESEGDFSIEEWEKAYETAERECSEAVEGLRKGWKG